MQWRHWFAPYPELDHIQLEVTTFCNAGCSYCPRTTAGKRWKNIHLTAETLSPLLPRLPSVPYVHLQGWGEPLLNPHFFSLAGLIIAHGCSCGTTTNGVLIDRKIADKIIAAGIDLVAFSLTGAGPSHDRFRCGAPLAQVLEGIRSLAAAKGHSRKLKPAIHIAYMLLRDGADEIVNLPKLLTGLSVDEVVVSTLDHVPHSALAGQVIPRSTPEWNRIVAQLAELKEELAREGIRLIFDAGASAAPEGTGICSERVDRALIIAADGGIHPCVFANLPDDTTGGKRKCFGGLGAEGLDKAWWSDEYFNFRASFGKRQLDDLCVGCPKLPLNLRNS